MLSWEPQLYMFLLALIVQCKMASLQHISADVTAAPFGTFASPIVEYPRLCLFAPFAHIAIIVVQNSDAIRSKCLYQFTLGESNSLLRTRVLEVRRSPLGYNGPIGACNC